MIFLITLTKMRFVTKSLQYVEIFSFSVTMLVIIIWYLLKVEETNMVCGKLEIDILNSFWNLTKENEDRDISIQDIVDDLSANGLDRAYTTIKTVMDRLTVKSILVRYKAGKKFFYKTTMSKEEMASEAIKEVAQNFFDGDYSDLIRFAEKQNQNILA